MTHQMPGARSRAEVMRKVQLARQNDTLRWVGDYARDWLPTGARAVGTASRESIQRDLQAYQRISPRPVDIASLAGESVTSTAAEPAIEVPSCAFHPATRGLRVAGADEVLQGQRYPLGQHQVPQRKSLLLVYLVSGA